ncbi:MAG: hypothetical protein IPO35_05470 [Uliginosibacterium sp.]|nr:hypothetical protein [Uliginosibacterium sp.]
MGAVSGRGIGFVLGASGHVTKTIIRPPKINAATDQRFADSDCDEWKLDGAVEHRGSWWPNWIDWALAARSGELIIKGLPRRGTADLGEIELAPGRYVKERS